MKVGELKKLVSNRALFWHLIQKASDENYIFMKDGKVIVTNVPEEIYFRELEDEEEWSPLDDLEGLDMNDIY